MTHSKLLNVRLGDASTIDYTPANLNAGCVESSIARRYWCRLP